MYVCACDCVGTEEIVESVSDVYDCAGINEEIEKSVADHVGKKDLKKIVTAVETEDNEESVLDGDCVCDYMGIQKNL